MASVRASVRSNVRFASDIDGTGEHRSDEHVIQMERLNIDPRFESDVDAPRPALTSAPDPVSQSSTPADPTPQLTPKLTPKASVRSRAEIRASRGTSLKKSDIIGASLVCHCNCMQNPHLTPPPGVQEPRVLC